MVKVVYFMHRKPGLDVESFQRYWHSTHGDIVRRLPGLRRYTQCHTLLSEYENPVPPVCDGIEEILFDSLGFMISTLEPSEERRAAIADLENFADTSRVFRVFTKECVIKEGSTHEGMVKKIDLVMKKSGMPLSEFQHHWREIHGPMVAKIETVTRHVQSHNLPLEYKKEHPPVYDGVAETWFEDTAAIRHLSTAEAYAACLDDRLNFLAGEFPSVLTNEVRVV